VWLKVHGENEGMEGRLDESEGGLSEYFLWDTEGS
jgi:hypothetical protein